MSQRERMTLLTLMRGIAVSGLMLAAITGPSDARALNGVIGVGFLLWLLDLRTASIPTEEDDALRGGGLVALGLGVLLLTEAAGLAISLSHAQDEASLFYGTAVILQIAALVTTARCGPDDMSLVAWGSCHATIALWAGVKLVSVASLTLAGQGVQVPRIVDAIVFWMSGLKFLFLACSFLLLLAALALGLLMEPARRRRAWTSLILTQAAVLLIFLRWPWENR